MPEIARLLQEKNRAYLELYELEIAVARLRHSKKVVPAAMLQRQEELAGRYEEAKAAARNGWRCEHGRAG